MFELASELSEHGFVWGAEWNRGDTLSRANVVLADSNDVLSLSSMTHATAFGLAASRVGDLVLSHVLTVFDVWVLSDGNLSTCVVVNSLHFGLDLESEWECHSFNVVEVEPDTCSWHLSLVDISCKAGLSWNKGTLSADVNDVVSGHTSAVSALHIWWIHGVRIRNIVVTCVKNCGGVESFVVLEGFLIISSHIHSI